MLSEISGSWTPEFAEAQRQALAACPDAWEITDDAAEDFLLAAQMIDWFEPREIGKTLRSSGIFYPPELTFDLYRLGRYLFRRWADPQIRQTFMQRVIVPHHRSVAGLRRSRRVDEAHAMVREYRLAAGLSALRIMGLHDLIPAVRAAFSAEEQMQYEGLLCYGKLKLHRLMTEPEPARLPTVWEEQKLLRRLRLREVQMRSLHGGLRRLGQERMRLLARLRESKSAGEPELRRLADELRTLGAELRSLEARHAKTLAAQEQQMQAEAAQARARVAAARAEYGAAIAHRDRLLGPCGR